MLEPFKCVYSREKEVFAWREELECNANGTEILQMHGENEGSFPSSLELPCFCTDEAEYSSW